MKTNKTIILAILSGVMSHIIVIMALVIKESQKQIKIKYFLRNTFKSYQKHGRVRKTICMAKDTKKPQGPEQLCALKHNRNI